MATAKVPLICLVEGDPFIRTALMSLLRSAGLHVEAFASDEAFLGHTPHERVDCLIVDVHLPGMSGVALQRTLTERQVPIPIIFLTGDHDLALARQAQNAGAIVWRPNPSRRTTCCTPSCCAAAGVRQVHVMPHRHSGHVTNRPRSGRSIRRAVLRPAKLRLSRRI
jgi:CheY-like chemotaxis protein